MKKGISLATLSIVVLLMIILATTITTTGAFVLNNSKKVKFASEIALVQEMVDEYASKKLDEYPTSSVVVVDLSNVSSNAIAEFSEEIENKNEITLYEIDFSLLGKTDLTYGNKQNDDETDVYAVSKKTGKVYYVKGVKIGKNVYYTLNDELKSSINYSSNLNAVTKDGIVFSTSKSSWTNKNIDSTIKVPSSSEYKNITVSILQNNNVKNVVMSDAKKGYKIFNITNVEGNYEVTVNYSKNSNPSTQNFSVSNFDNEAPKFTISKTQKLINESDNIKQTYVKVDVENDVSGIRYTKYETDTIDSNIAKQYFNSNGIEFKDGAFTVDKFTKNVTVYVEDKAGNYSIQTITLDTTATENDYIKEGLVLHLDGFSSPKNIGSNNVWEDISKNKNNAILYNMDGINGYYDENKKGYTFLQNDSYAKTIDKLGITGDSLYTIEVVSEVIKESPTGPNSPIWFGEEKYNGVSGEAVFLSYSDSGTNLTANFINTWASSSSFDSIINKVVNSSIRKVKTGETSVGDKSYVKLTLNSKTLVQNNGISVLGSMPTTMVSNIKNSQAEIGRSWQYQNEDRSFCGTIYSIRVYNRALSDKEINQNYKIDKIRFGI